MNSWERFESLVASARGESGPPVEVTTGVLSEIRRRSARQGANLPLWLFSGLSLAAGSIALLLAAEPWAAATDPLATLFDTLTMVMQ